MGGDPTRGWLGRWTGQSPDRAVGEEAVEASQRTQLSRISCFLLTLSDQPSHEGNGNKTPDSVARLQSSLELSM